MSISGDLKNFPIIDIIQLMHGTRNSGVLRLSSEKGESQLVFHNGDLVSASYLDGRVRIGQVLVSAGAITDEQLTRALEIQKQAGRDRKPLVLTLLENEMIDEAEAYNGIEALIEMTIVETLTWKSGQFALDNTNLSDTGTGAGQPYSKSRFQQQVLLNAQAVVMEALRIFDEKMRDGKMDDILSIAGLSGVRLVEADTESGEGDLNVLPDKVAASLQQYAEQRKRLQSGADQGYRTPEVIRRLVLDEFSDATNDQKRQIATILAGIGHADTDESVAESRGLAVLAITSSRLLSTMIRTVCQQQDIYVICSEDNSMVDINIRLLQCQDLYPVLMVDLPHGELSANGELPFAEYLQHARMSYVLVTCSHMWSKVALPALATGVRAVIPRPCRTCSPQDYLQQSILFCNNLGAFLRRLSPRFILREELLYFACLNRMHRCRTNQEICETLVTCLREQFDRVIVFNLSASELVAVQSSGVVADGDAPLSLKIPFDDQLILQEALTTGQIYYGFHSDSACRHTLYSRIGAPESLEVLLLPLLRAGKVVTMVYADFGARPSQTPTLRMLELIQQFANAQVSIVAYRQKLKSMLQQK
ncbi:MAG TPA: DUF4388 domain-containing protein [Deltaproteobacteria bacterium]|nr:DUF4388 domain-containing protein [Deltaproteobacteria bacterium]